MTNLEELAHQLGLQYGEDRRFADINGSTSEGMYQEALQRGCPASHFDVFKYAAQEAWRGRGEPEVRGGRCVNCGTWLADEG